MELALHKNSYFVFFRGSYGCESQYTIHEITRNLTKSRWAIIMRPLGGLADLLLETWITTPLT
jgi:hypothetical protein